VTATSALTPDSGIDRIFGPVVEGRTYRHLFYELISFPFGLMTFVMMVAGLSTGVGLAIVFIGFVILAVTLAAARVCRSIERGLARSLLGAAFSSPSAPVGLRAGLNDAASWKALAYFVLRLPLAVLGFAASMVLLSSVPVVATPLLYPYVPVLVGGVRVTTSEEAMLVSLIGCVLFLLGAHAVNGVAALSRRLAVALL
jgi:hypothetical protein